MVALDSYCSSRRRIVGVMIVGTSNTLVPTIVSLSVSGYVKERCEFLRKGKAAMKTQKEKKGKRRYIPMLLNIEHKHVLA